MKSGEVLAALRTGPGGLCREERERRMAESGPNELEERKRATPLRIFLGQFDDVFVIMLLVAAGIAFLVGETVDAVTIAAIVSFNAIVGFIQEYRSEKAFEAMKRMTAPRARVLRDGAEAVVPARELVPGDILLLEEGDRVAADARLLEAIGLKTVEAALTGESEQVEKTADAVDRNAPVAERRNSLFMATHVASGRGKAVVTSTGMRTEFGKIAGMVQALGEEETPLKRKLERFARKLGIFVLLVSALIFALELYKVLFDGTPFGDGTMKRIIEAFETSLALAVSAVPEGLPAVVTVSLALGARELARRNAIIRNLSSAETLGAVTVICSDKTGTLTKGEMTVRRIYAGGRMVDVTGAGYEPRGEFLHDGSPIKADGDAGLMLLLRAGMLCTNGRYDGKEVTGDTTEGALIVAAAKAGMNKEAFEARYPRVREIPFTSERKCMTTVHRTPGGTLEAYVKGAPEVVLERCARVFRNGRAENLTPRERQDILDINGQMGSHALRVLCIACRELPPEAAGSPGNGDAESDLVFLGLAGMIDPPRDEAREAVRKCREAGIKTVMITGDHERTAVAVAAELGMPPGDRVLTGAGLDALSDENFEEFVGGVSVYARVSPEHKIRVVKALKKRGHIVAMTGDGVNDAPALKQADIGVAMGITGTDVTREAADMVLADDNFATIVSAVEGGRNIYDNIRKFSFFLLRSNFDELLVIGSFALMGLDLPLTAGMILWINLVTDGGPALALSMDPPEEDIMKRPPRNPDEGILHGRAASILATFFTQFVGTGILFYVARYVWGRPLAEAQAMAFVQATLQELTMVWNCRSEKRNAFKVGFTSNRFLLAAVAASALLTVLIPYTGLFGTAPLRPSDWAIVLPFSLAGFLILPEVFYGRKVWRWT
jgi:Ca2+-transporting ATPase